MDTLNLPGSVPVGRYRHYKGNTYTVLGTARHSETQEELVVYRPEYGEQGLWVRPQAMFTEQVQVNGQAVPRFQPIPAASDPLTRVENIFETLPAPLPQEVVQTLIQAADVRIERIISHGHCSPPGFWYEQPQQEWVIVLQGAARLEWEHHTLEMRPGDYVNIPAFQKHRVAWTTPDEPTIWLGVRYRFPAESREIESRGEPLSAQLGHPLGHPVSD
ncbi:MAG: DUF1653 domain-containing protein [Bacteroidales bacterium]|nr:DUF1653 domain-containing protein [Bacteroidales bacterium]